MTSVRRRDDNEPGCTAEGRVEGRLAALARELVDKVGVDGATRYCSSLGWRGVLEEVELLRRERLQQDRLPSAQL